MRAVTGRGPQIWRLPHRPRCRADVHAYPQEGPTIDLSMLPALYSAFAIRFPIFTDATFARCSEPHM